MVLVIGGCYQGKTEYVKKHFNENYVIVEDYHQKIQKQLEEGKDPFVEFDRLIEEEDLNRLVLICDEVGAGVVPMEQKERIYRETVGRICCKAAQLSEEVIRVYAGIGTKIK